ncbi:MAG: hypothetical protein IMZ44_01200 [Planctomycetes bacterium]|nr:hypothetical protein [Planctomycetota bacterium]
MAGEAGRVNGAHFSSVRNELPAPDGVRQVAALILDLGKDGLNDFLIASYEKIVWYRHDPAAAHRAIATCPSPHIS